MKSEELSSSAIPPTTEFNRNVTGLRKLDVQAKTGIDASTISDTVKTSQLNHIQLNQLQASNTASVSISKEIRKVNHSLDSIDAHLHQMQASLESIVKIFPPYPPGSSERIDALRQFSAFRKMIDQIAQPPHADGLENILGDPDNSPAAGDWSYRKGHGGDDELIIRHQPVYIGPQGLDIPELDVASTDHQISHAIVKTSSAIELLATRRQNFVSDANRVITHFS
jgi:hypothetical protein